MSDYDAYYGSYLENFVHAAGADHVHKLVNAAGTEQEQWPAPDRRLPSYAQHLTGAQLDLFGRLRDDDVARDAHAQFKAEQGGDGWAPADIPSLLAEGLTPPKPTLVQRTDGACLFYPGKTHTIAGESGAGKSFVAQWAVATVLRDGGTVLYLDYESSAASVLARLVDMGLTPQDLDRLTYVAPTGPPTGPHFDRLLEGQVFTLAIIDGVTAALQTAGLPGDAVTNNNDVLTRWDQMLPRRLADVTGAAVVQVDHVTKAKDNRAGYAIGGQAKRAVLTGIMYTLAVKTPFSRGHDGALVLSATKDREGYHDGPTADIRVRTHPDGGVSHMVLHAPDEGETSPDERARERVMRYLLEWDATPVEPGKTKTPPTARQIRTDVPVNNNDVDRARRWLVENGYIEVTTAGQSLHHRPVCDYVPEGEFADGGPDDEEGVPAVVGAPAEGVEP